MPKIIRDMSIVEARIEQIVSFPNMDALNEYLSKKDGKVLIDKNFGSKSAKRASWEESCEKTAIRKSVQNELLLHICYAYNNIAFNKNGILLSERG